MRGDEENVVCSFGKDGRLADMGSFEVVIPEGTYSTVSCTCGCVRLPNMLRTLKRGLRCRRNDLTDILSSFWSSRNAGDSDCAVGRLGRKSMLVEELEDVLLFAECRLEPVASDGIGGASRKNKLSKYAGRERCMVIAILPVLRRP